MLSIHQTRRAIVGVPSFSHDQLDDLAHTALASEGARLALAIDARDQPARDLSKSYLKAKIKAGGKPIRDLHLTGAMLAARGVTETGEHSVTVGFSDGLQRAKAAQNEKTAQMLGVSPADKLALDTHAREILSANVQILNAK